MKKGCALTLALLISLPGCCRKDKKAQKPTKKEYRTEQHIDLMSEVNIPLADDESDDFSKDEDGRVLSFFDEDLEEFTAFEDDYGMVASSYEPNSLDQDAELFSWVDAQVEDEFKTVYFDFNRFGIRADQKDVVEMDIKQVKQILDEADANVTVVIDGHTCQEGDAAYNVALSEKRAKSVADLFVAAGIAPDKIKVVGRGQEVPAVVNGKVVDGSREMRWPNRRVEVRLIYS